MRKAEAKEFYGFALAYVRRHHADELRWVKNIGPDTFKDIETEEFLSQYCWVVYATYFLKRALSSTEV